MLRPAAPAPPPPPEQPQWSLLTIASLSAWAEEAMTRLGALRFEILLDLCEAAGHLTPEARAALVAGEGAGIADARSSAIDKRDSRHPAAARCAAERRVRAAAGMPRSARHQAAARCRHDAEGVASSIRQSRPSCSPSRRSSAIIAVTNAVLPSVGRTTGALDLDIERGQDRIASQIEIVHATGQNANPDAEVWVKNIGASTITRSTAWTSSSGRAATSSASRTASAGCIAPCWEYSVENATTFEPTATLQIIDPQQRQPERGPDVLREGRDAERHRRLEVLHDLGARDGKRHPRPAHRRRPDALARCSWRAAASWAWMRSASSSRHPKSRIGAQNRTRLTATTTAIDAIGHEHHDHGAEQRPDATSRSSPDGRRPAVLRRERRALRQVDPVHVGRAGADTWTTGAFTNDVFEPRILNPGESMEIADPREPGGGRGDDEQGGHRHGEGRHSADVLLRTAIEATDAGMAIFTRFMPGATKKVRAQRGRRGRGELAAPDVAVPARARSSTTSSTQLTYMSALATANVGRENLFQKTARARLHDVGLLPPRPPRRAATELRLRARLPARRRRDGQRGREEPAAAVLELALVRRAGDRVPRARDRDPARAVLAASTSATWSRCASGPTPTSR